MKKKVLGTAVAVLGIITLGYISNSIASKSDADLNTSDVSEENELFVQEYSASYSFSLSDVDEMYTNHEFVVLIHVDKVNPGETYRENIDKHIMPFTPGEATVLKVLKGNIKNEKIKFFRLGGTVPYSEYVKSLYPDEKEKFESSVSDGRKRITQVKMVSHNDIDIEEGKVYLVYMNRYDDFHTENEYSIEGFEYGLREVNLSLTKNLDLQSLNIKNNKTNEFEKLNSAVSSKLINRMLKSN